MTDATFPCPTCGAPLEVRQTKKSKPYLICDTCGMQMFVRNGVGIHRFEVLLAEFDGSDIWKRLAVLEERYRKQCPGAATSLGRGQADADQHPGRIVAGLPVP